VTFRDDSLVLLLTVSCACGVVIMLRSCGAGVDGVGSGVAVARLASNLILWMLASCGMLESAGGSGTLNNCGLSALGLRAVTLHAWRRRNSRRPSFWRCERWGTLGLLWSQGRQLGRNVE
jgi:hypothetical protein